MPTVTLTTTFTEEEPDGWAFSSGDETVGIFEGWSHDCPASDDEYAGIPEYEDGGWAGEFRGYCEGVLWERQDCQSCGAILVTLRTAWYDEEAERDA